MTAEAVLDRPSSDDGGKGLKSGSLGLVSSIVIGVASTAPAYSLAATLGGIVALIGLQTPAIVLLAFVPAFAQSRKDPLTEQQIEDVREAGDQPVPRIKLFVGYVDDRAKQIHSLSTDAGAQNREVRIHNLLEEFTRLSDDLQDNMDNFDQQHANPRDGHGPLQSLFLEDLHHELGLHLLQLFQCRLQRLPVVVRSSIENAT